MADSKNVSTIKTRIANATQEELEHLAKGLIRLEIDAQWDKSFPVYIGLSLDNDVREHKGTSSEEPDICVWRFNHAPEPFEDKDGNSIEDITVDKYLAIDPSYLRATVEEMVQCVQSAWDYDQ